MSLMASTKRALAVILGEKLDGSTRYFKWSSTSSSIDSSSICGGAVVKELLCM